MATYYAVDALATLDALALLTSPSQMEALFPRKNTAFNQASARNGKDLEAGNNNEAAIGDGNDTKNLQIFTVQFQAQNRKSTRLNSRNSCETRMPTSAGKTKT